MSITSRALPIAACRFVAHERPAVLVEGRSAMTRQQFGGANGAPKRTPPRRTPVAMAGSAMARRGSHFSTRAKQGYLRCATWDAAAGGGGGGRVLALAARVDHEPVALDAVSDASVTSARNEPDATRRCAAPPARRGTVRASPGSVTSIARPLILASPSTRSRSTGAACSANPCRAADPPSCASPASSPTRARHCATCVSIPLIRGRSVAAATVASSVCWWAANRPLQRGREIGRRGLDQSRHVARGPDSRDAERVVAIREPVDDLYAEFGVDTRPLTRREDRHRLPDSVHADMHPDVHPGRPPRRGALRVGEAWRTSVLSDPARRARYDSGRRRPCASTLCRRRPLDHGRRPCCRRIRCPAAFISLRRSARC